MQSSITVTRSSFQPIHYEDEIEAKGNGHYVSFANYDYLGLADHPQVRKAAHDAIDKFGVGALASRLVGGERSTHRELEQALANFLGFDDSLALVSGYLANVTVLTHLMGGRDAILLDELSHNSVASGGRGAAAETIVFRHNDLDHLDHILTERRENYRNVIIVVESLYSMDGDTVDLERLCQIKEKHGVWLLVDEAHSIGVLGETGRGLCEETRRRSRARRPDDRHAVEDLRVLRRLHLRQAGHHRLDALHAARLRLFGRPVAGHHRRGDGRARSARRPSRSASAKLAHNAEFFRDTMQAAGLDTGPAIGRAVVPVLFNSDRETMMASQHLLENGVYVPPVVRIGVPKDQPRLRFFISAAHREDDINARRAICW